MNIRRQIPPRPAAQRGMALLLIAVFLVLGGTWAIMSALNAARRDTAATRTLNGEVLRQAKAGLLGYLSVKAGADAYPGSLPCPEDPNPSIEGAAQSYCTLPAVGRLPWRTLGMDKLTDSAGEPLWYVLSPGFNRANSGVALKINSDTPAQLTLDGSASAAVALIIAPGAPMNVKAAAGCSARTQVRNQSFPLDHRDYLECENASSPVDIAFVSLGPSDSFNDQVLAVSHADVFNVVEAAVAKRIESEIAPLIRGVYDSADWNSTATTPKFPFAAPFDNPDTSSFTGSVGTYQGLLPLTYSTLPNSSDPCVSGGSDPRCNPSLVAWRHDGTLSRTVPLWIKNNARVSVSCIPSASPSCTPPAGFAPATISVPAFNPYISVTEVWNGNTTDRSTLTRLDCSATTSTLLSCAVTYGRSCDGCSAFHTVRPRVRLTARALNVAKAFKTFNPTTISDFPSQFQERTTATSYGASPLGVLRGDGDADITTEWLLPSKSCNSSFCYTFTITIPIGLIMDHAVVSSADGVTGWFISNGWHKLTYYAISSGNAPGSSGSCVAGGSPACLTVNGSSGTTSPNAILILAGRNIGANARPSSTLADYLESANADGADTVFESTAPPTLSLSTLSGNYSKPLASVFNDRLMSLYP